MGLLPVDAKISVADYTEQWLTTLQVRPSTRANYVSYLRNHILPALGRRPLSSLRRSHIAAFVADLVDKGLAAVDGQALLQRAVDDHALGLLRPGPAREPLLQDQAPRDTRPHAAAAHAPSRCTALLAAAPDCDRAVLATAVGTGMRQGETLGLRLVHLNLLRRELAVEQQADEPSGGQPFLTSDLKTPSSRRVHPAPPVRRPRARPAPRDLRRRRRGRGLRQPPRRDLATRQLQRLGVEAGARRAGLDERFGFHALRHTYASGLIAENIHPRVIQARLGHKSIVETMDTYGHLFPDGRDETTSALDRIFGAVGAAEA